MNTIAEDTVRDIVGQQQEEGLGQTVNEFGKSVEKEAEKKVEVMQEMFGDSVKEIAGDVMKEAKSYHESRNELVDSKATVDNIAETDGAAGMVEMDTREKVLDVATMDYELADADYRKRVDKHEDVHQKDQAAKMNQQEVTVIDERGETETVEMTPLVEWHASTTANKPEDLTPEYKDHVVKGEKVVDALGGDANRVKAALKSGDIQGLQREIVEHNRERFLEAMMKKAEPEYAVAA